MRNRAPMGRGMPRQKGVFKRAVKSLFKCYPVMTTITVIFIIGNAIISSLPSIFMQPSEHLECE